MTVQRLVGVAVACLAIFGEGARAQSGRPATKAPAKAPSKAPTKAPAKAAAPSHEEPARDTARAAEPAPAAAPAPAAPTKPTVAAGRKRERRSMQLDLAGEADEVFPLFGPVREAD